MSEFKLTTVEEFEAATERLLETGAKVGADAWQFRVKNQTPHCKFGEQGICCRICAMGPCRITPKAPRGVCGCDAHGIVGRNFLKFTAGGAATHSDHGREICHTLYCAKEGGNYQVKDPEKLLRIAKEWGVETEGKDIYDLAHEMAELGLMEYGKPFGYQRFLDRMPAGQKEKLIENEIAPRAIDREVASSLHMTHMGCSSLPEALVKQSLRCGLADGWGGSMMGTEFSDVLFGTPKPIDTEANLGVMVEENVNIVVHGHDPSLSEMICEYADSKEMIDYAKSVGAKGITVSGVCCTSNEVAMRRGVPMAGNFLQQENVVLTGACEAIVVDVQCIFPALGPLSKCFHTKFVTTSPIAQMPDSEFIRFNAETAGENAKAIVKMAIDNFKNRKPELVHIPQLKQKATVGYSLEAIVKVLDGVTNSQVDVTGTTKPLLECITSGVIRGAVAMVGCNLMDFYTLVPEKQQLTHLMNTFLAQLERLDCPLGMRQLMCAGLVMELLSSGYVPGLGMENSLERYLHLEFYTACGSWTQLREMMGQFVQVYSALLERVGNSGSSRLVQSFRSAIHADLRNTSLSQVADTLNMSPSYISMIFKEKTGQNFKDYLFQTRMNRCV